MVTPYESKGRGGGWSTREGVLYDSFAHLYRLDSSLICCNRETSNTLASPGSKFMSSCYSVEVAGPGLERAILHPHHTVSVSGFRLAVPTVMGQWDGRNGQDSACSVLVDIRHRSATHPVPEERHVL